MASGSEVFGGMGGSKRRSTAASNRTPSFSFDTSGAPF